MRLLVRAQDVGTEKRGHVVASADDGALWGALEAPPDLGGVFWYVDIAGEVGVPKSVASLLKGRYIEDVGGVPTDQGPLWDLSGLFDLLALPVTNALDAGGVLVITSAADPPVTQPTPGSAWPDPHPQVTGEVAAIRQWAAVRAQVIRRDSVGAPSLEDSPGTPGGPAGFDI